MFISSYNDQRKCEIFSLKIKEQVYECKNKPNFIKTFKTIKLLKIFDEL